MPSLEEAVSNVKTKQKDQSTTPRVLIHEGTSISFANFLETVTNHLKCSITSEDWSVQHQLLCFLMSEIKKELGRMLNVSIVNPADVEEAVSKARTFDSCKTPTKIKNNSRLCTTKLPKNLPSDVPVNGLQKRAKKKFSWIDDNGSGSSDDGGKEEATAIGVTSPEIHESVDSVSKLEDLVHSLSGLEPKPKNLPKKSTITAHTIASIDINAGVVAPISNVPLTLPDEPIKSSLPANEKEDQAQIVDNLSAVLNIDLSELPTTGSKELQGTKKKINKQLTSAKRTPPKEETPIKKTTPGKPKRKKTSQEETPIKKTTPGKPKRKKPSQEKIPIKNITPGEPTRKEPTKKETPIKKSKLGKSNSKTVDSKVNNKIIPVPSQRPKTWVDMIYVFFKTLKNKPQLLRRTVKYILTLFENEGLTEKPILFDVVAGFLKNNKSKLCSTTLYVLQQSFSRWWNRAVRKEIEVYFKEHVDGFNYVSLAEIMKFEGVMKLLKNHSQEKMTRIIVSALDRSELVYYEKDKKLCQRKNPAQEYPPIPKQKNLPKLPDVKEDEENSERKLKRKQAQRKRQREMTESRKESENAPDRPPGLDSPPALKRQRTLDRARSKSNLTNNGLNSNGFSESKKVEDAAKQITSLMNSVLTKPQSINTNTSNDGTVQSSQDIQQGSTSLDGGKTITQEKKISTLTNSKGSVSDQHPVLSGEERSKKKEAPIQTKPFPSDTTMGETKNTRKSILTPTKTTKSCTRSEAKKKQTTPTDPAIASPSLSPSFSPKLPPPLDMKKKDAKTSDEQSVSTKDSLVNEDVQARVFKPAFMKDLEDKDESETADDFFDFSEEDNEDANEEDVSKNSTIPIISESKLDSSELVIPVSKPDSYSNVSPKETNTKIFKKPIKVPLPKSVMKAPLEELPRIRVPPPPPLSAQKFKRGHNATHPRTERPPHLRKLPPKPNLWPKPLISPSVRMPPPPSRVPVRPNVKPYSSMRDRRQSLPIDPRSKSKLYERSRQYFRNTGRISSISVIKESTPLTQQPIQSVSKPTVRISEAVTPHQINSKKRLSSLYVAVSDNLTRAADLEPDIPPVVSATVSRDEDRRRKRRRRTRSRSPPRKVTRRRSSPSRARRERTRRSLSLHPRRRRSPSRRSRRSPPHRSVSVRHSSPKPTSKRRRVERRTVSEIRKRTTPSESQLSVQLTVNQPKKKKKKKERAKMRRPDDPEVVSAFKRITKRQLFADIHGAYNIRKNLCGDDDIAIGQIKVSLRDPFSLCCIQSPARGNKVCTHIQPFDLKVFLQQGDRPRICPVCNAEVAENLIVVDKYLEKVFANARKKHDPSLEAIFFYLETSGISSKLMWKPVIEGRVPLVS